MNSKYNVGDIVQIISKYAPGRSSEDYLCGFPQRMLEEVKGKVVRILEVVPRSRSPHKILSTDPYTYNVVDVNTDILFQWTFSAEMFEDFAYLEII